MDTLEPSSSRRSLRTRTSSSTGVTSGATSSPTGSESPRSDVSRSSRLNNPEFAARHKAFMAKVTAASKGSMDSYLSTELSEENTPGKRKASTKTEEPVLKRRRNTKQNSNGLDTLNDAYCWICHKEGSVICCETCPRVFHLKCVQLESSPAEDWVCPECVLIMTAENMDTRSRAMRLLTVDQLCTLLKHALARMKSVLNSQPFLKPVDPLQFPAYKDYISCPMDIQSMERNIRRKQYGSTEAMLADCKWILHNCIIFNSPISKLTSIAKNIVKVCKHEMQEIENCPDCYLNAHIKKDTWFTEACRFPHPLVWAKLKGFPYWPGKLMRVNSENTADIRFFGAHDRAWICMKDVFLFSERPPLDIKKKRGNLDDCVTEVDTHIRKLRDRFGEFAYAPHKTQYDPNREEEMLKILYPKFMLPFELGTLSRRARSYSFTGSERSRDATPTPSETSVMEEEEEEIEEVEEAEKPQAAPAAETSDNLSNDFEKQPETVEEEEPTTDQPTATDAAAFTIVNETLESQEEDTIIQNDDNATESSEVDAEPQKEIEEPPVIQENKMTEEMIEDVLTEQIQIQEEASVDTVENDVQNDVQNEAEKESENEIENEVENEIVNETETEVENEAIRIHKEVENEVENEVVEDSNVEKEETNVTQEINSVNEEPEINTSSNEEVREEDSSVPDLKETEETQECVDSKEVEAEPGTDLATDISGDDGTEMTTSVDDKEERPEDEGVQEKRTSVSPPCEVTSTTASETQQKEVEEEEEPVTVVPKPNRVEGIIAETSEPVIVEDEDPVDEIDDVEPVHQIETDTDEVMEVDADPVDEITDKEDVNEEVSEDVVEAANESQDTGETSTKGAQNAAEEIDDVEPEENRRAPVDPTKLLAAGVSITVIDKKKKSESNEDEAKTQTKPVPPISNAGPDLDLSSDISVTVVQKQKPPVQPGKFTLSLKSESELLDPEKATATDKKSFARKSLDEDKTPPDPIVTISKVGNMKDLKDTKDSKEATVNERMKPAVNNSSSPGPQLQSPASSPSPGMMGSPFRPGFRGNHAMGGPRGPMMNMMGQGILRGQFRGPMPGPMSMPNLQPRPTGMMSVPPSLPSSAGPVAEQLNRVAGKLADYMRQNLEDLFKDLSQQGSPEATIKGLQLELEKMQWRHNQELAEVKHNADLILMEMRGSLEQDKQRAIADCRKQAEIEKQKSIAETKKKQWCANCGKEAIFYCCWNTSYCDYPCQQAHWPMHMTTCAQNGAGDAEEEAESLPAAQHFMVGSGGRPSGGRGQGRSRMPGPGLPASMAAMRFNVQQRMPGQSSFTRPYFM